ncbi:putative disease resistance protein RGA4 [Rhodamnia argentea]|uniref:Disease resistance protein RGA4 n=1 Tax=Rhodamnia argentea TaxID=178133 RepID=A0ABM3HHJ0_9MYRT|nr:putative disease resistance protein RGA4 [Rhodamnia argentea]
MACRKEEEIQDPDMLAIGKEIARKCSGVPPVVRTVGSLLFFKKTKLEWLHFKEKELPEVSQREDRIMSILRLSYYHLPSHLKQCFALCSLFPKDYEIKKQTLVNLWVAEGFIEPSNRSQHLDDIAHGYFMDLLWSNFFQDFQRDPFTEVETCKMHDLMHDLACLVAGTECWVAWDDTKSVLKRTRRISHGLTFNVIGELPISRFRASTLRTFFSVVPKPMYGEMEQREPTSEADLRLIIQSCKSLRILDVYATNVKKVPRSICKLKHLTYLDCSHNSALKRLPDSITRLQNLQTLNLYGCSALEELPRGIRELVSFRNLYIDDCQKLSYMPCELGQLSSLHRLTHFILPKDKTLAKNYCGLGELNGLNNIRGSLSIENLKHVSDVVAESKAANLIGKSSLESLELHWGYLESDDAVTRDRDEALLDGLRPHSNLQKLKIDGYEGESFPRWMMNSLVISLPNLVEQGLKSLWSVDIRCVPKLASLPQWLLQLSDLHLLSIRNCLNLKALPEQIEALQSLQWLEIIRCPSLTSLPKGMRGLASLNHLRIAGCMDLEERCKEDAGEDWYKIAHIPHVSHQLRSYD